MMVLSLSLVCAIFHSVLYGHYVSTPHFAHLFFVICLLPFARSPHTAECVRPCVWHDAACLPCVLIFSVCAHCSAVCQTVVLFRNKTFCTFCGCKYMGMGMGMGLRACVWSCDFIWHIFGYVRVSVCADWQCR